MRKLATVSVLALIASSAIDAQAFEELSHRFQPVMTRLVTRMPPTDLDGAVSNLKAALLHTVKHMPPDVRHPSGYIAKSLKYAHLRFVERERTYEARFEPTSVMPDIADQGASPEEALIQREREQQVRAAIAKLTSEQQEVIRLRHYESLSIEETAARMGVSDRTVERLMAEAQKRLRRALEDLDA